MIKLVPLFRRPCILPQRELTKPRHAPVPLFGENRQVFVAQGQYAKCDLAHWANKV
jgi:hypothetical protein